MTEDIKVIANNRKASFEYFLLEKFEAGLVLQGSEIKSIRAGQMSIQESYVDIVNGEEAWLVEANIAPYVQANRFNHDPKRKRKLLLHKKQIREMYKTAILLLSSFYVTNERRKKKESMWHHLPSAESTNYPNSKKEKLILVIFRAN